MKDSTKLEDTPFQGLEDAPFHSEKWISIKEGRVRLVTHYLNAYGNRLRKENNENGALAVSELIAHLNDRLEKRKCECAEIFYHDVQKIKTE